MAIQKERCFPRGGKKLTVNKLTKAKRKVKKVQLFDTSKKKAKSKKNAKRPQDLEQTEHLVAEPLSYRSLSEGMTLLGCVIGVTDYYVRLSLPGRLVGQVTIANVSGCYSKIIRSLLDKKEVSEKYYELKEMFQPGQFVVAKVQKITKHEHKNGYKLNLTLDPACVNFNYSHSLMKSGMVLQGAVKSVEDHGYMIDFGIKSLTAFLKSEKAKNYISQFNGGKQLGIGQVLLCSMQKVDNSSPASTVVQVTVDPREVMNSIAEIDQNLNVNTLSPGTLVKSLVVENIGDGVMVEFLNLKGYVHQDHVGDPPPKIAAICHARILYTMPLVNTIYLSLVLGNHSLFSNSGTKDESAPEVGQVLKNCIVRSASRRGLVIGLGKGNKHKGFVARKKLRDGEEMHPGEVKKLFSAGMSVDVRIIGKDMMENIFICSSQRSVLAQEYFSVGDLGPGMKVMGTVMALKGNGLVVRLSNSNGLEGYAPFTQLADFPIQHPEKRFPPGKKVKARVLKVIREKGNLLLTLKPSLVDSELPILDKYEGAENGRIADGTIFKILDAGLVVIFYNGVKGFVSIDDTGHSSESSSLNEEFFEGQTIRCRVIGFNSHHQRLKLSLRFKTEGDPEILSRLGTLFTLKVTEVNDEELVVKVIKKAGSKERGLKQRKGIIPAAHLSDCHSLSQCLLATYKPGDRVPSAVLFAVRQAESEQCTLIFSLRHSAIEFSQMFGQGVNDSEGMDGEDSSTKEVVGGSLGEGSVIPCSISKAIAKGLLLEAPIPQMRTMFVPLHLVSDEYLDYIDKQVYAAHRLIFGKICKSDDQKQKLTLSTKLSEVWNGYDLEPSLNIVKSYLSAIAYIREHIQSDGKNSLGQFVEGQMVKGTVKSICGLGRACIEVHGIVGVKGKVKPSAIATIMPHHYKEKPISVGDKVSGVVMLVDYVDGQLHLTLKTRIMEELKAAAGGSFAVGKCIRAEILLSTQDVAVAIVKGNICHGELIFLPVRTHCNDFCGNEESETILVPGDIHKVIVSGKESGRMIGLIKKKVTLLSNYNAGKVVRKVRKRPALVPGPLDEASILPSAAKRQKTVAECERTLVNGGGELSGDEECPGSDVGPVKGGVESRRKVVDITEPTRVSFVDMEEGTRRGLDDVAWERLPRLPVDEGFVWDVDIHGLSSAITTQHDASDESSMDEQEESEVAHKGKKSKNKQRDGILQREQEEASVREAEERLMDPDTCPQTADDFDRLVLSSPDSSIVWLKYIAFHLQNTEIEKARAVAQRALKTINFREEQEKFNVWVCLLNLENLYGTKESLDKVLQDALQMNDSMKVYFQMLQIYLDSKKIEELDALMEVMLKKCRTRKEAWVQAGTMCMKSDRVEKAGELLRRSFKSLPKHEHVEVIGRWAQLEARYGSVDRAQSLLEGVLAACPRRTDIWSSLVDTLLRAGRVESARNVLQRAIAQNLPVRKMKVLFKKFLSLEETHGTPEGAARVRQLALEYVEKGAAGSSA
ncbi:rRNA biogenesis protein RRP5 [Hetaerina americana]|uniref:rRNA biogenesis protein RRP5 n=1 Tax=Hetaerina americana TaxID=62018 RepID=UPI003A7F307B